uniref:Uncharacterized protein n=1 Tax=Anguilla anguilla TaxID=7936 RepID=A0A0E9TBN3_ANGAN
MNKVSGLLVARFQPSEMISLCAIDILKVKRRQSAQNLCAEPLNIPLK